MASDESDIIKETIGFWSVRYGEELSPEDAREIVRNVTSFFLLLQEWEKKAS